MIHTSHFDFAEVYNADRKRFFPEPAIQITSTIRTNARILCVLLAAALIHIPPALECRIEAARPPVAFGP